MRAMKLAPGMRSPIAPLIVCAPSRSVSERPREMQQTISEHVAAFGSAQSWTSSMARKSTSTSRGIASTVATPVAGALGLDLFFAGDEGDFVGADAGNDLVIDLAREQAQR